MSQVREFLAGTSLTKWANCTCGMAQSFTSVIDFIYKTNCGQTLNRSRKLLESFLLFGKDVDCLDNLDLALTF